MCSELRVLIKKKKMQSRQLSLSFFLFFSLGGELDMGHASLC